MQRIGTLAKVLQLGMSRRPANLLLGTRGSFEAVQLQELDTELGKIVQSFLAGQFGDFHEQMAALGPAERALYLSEVFSKAEVLPAWERLAQILKAGFFSIVLTTSSDNLLEQALARQGLVPARDYTVFVVGVNRDEELRSFLHSSFSLKLIKLHGDLSFGSIKLTPEETFSFPSAIVDQLVELTGETLVVVGYEERHRDVLNILDRKSNASLWWISAAGLDWGRTEDRSVLQAMLDRKSDRNIISGSEGAFSRFIASLHTQLGLASQHFQDAQVDAIPSTTEYGEDVTVRELQSLPHLALRISSKTPNVASVQITDAGPLSFTSDQRVDDETRQQILQAVDRVAGVVNYRRRRVRGGSPRGLEEFQNQTVEAELRDLGRLMFRLFLTRNAKEALKQRSIVILETSDKWVAIPWELLFDGEDFLCLKHQVGRRVITERPSMPPRRKSGEKLRLLLIGDPTDNLPGALHETKQIIQLLAGEDSLDVHSLVGPRECRKLDVMRVLSRGDWDIVHYAGHAHFSFLDPNNSGWILAGGELKAFEIVNLFGEQPPALVFSNACESGREAEHGEITYENEVYGLASGFMSAGASVYIGALWPVHDDAAALIAAEFYRSAARRDTIGQALGIAKRQMIDKLGMDEIAWASFVIYGSPDFRL